MTKEQIKEKFKVKYGLFLENYINENDFQQDEVMRFFERQKRILESYGRTIIYTFKYSDLKGTKKELFDELILEQMYYVLNTFDYTTISGLDIGTNTNIPQSELLLRYISPIVKMELNNTGLLFRGLW